MPLCSVCLEINFDTIIRWPDGKRHPRAKCRQYKKIGIYFYDARDWTGTEMCDFEKTLQPHHKSLEKLKVSAWSCELCRLIESCVSESLESIKKFKDWGFDFEDAPASPRTFWLLDRGRVNGFEIIGCHDETGYMYSVMGGAGICVREDSPLASFVSGRTVSLDPRLSSVLADFSHLMHDCKDNHGHDEPEKGHPPTRILRIEDDGQTVSLTDGKNIEGGYAALSHCWGGDTQFTLHTGSVTKLEQGLSITDLPKTFQDALWVANRLGISYLWIDSVCIFQDDPSDWTRESARMAQVYGNSVVTIAASRAANTSEGFLEKRAQRNYVAVPFHHGLVSGEILIFPLHLTDAGDASSYSRLEKEPLKDRGWALQERYLSSHTIHFESSQVCFECKAAFITEDRCSTSALDLYWQYNLPSPIYVEINWVEAWEDVVELYSCRKLSLETDKLPAIAGIAEWFSKIAAAASVKNRYLAGLWQSIIILDLCWSLDYDTGHGRVVQFRAPTWSWASTDGEVWFRRMSHSLATFQNAHIDLDSRESPFGRISGGWILLRARKYAVLRNFGGNRKFTLSSFEGGPNFDVLVSFDDHRDEDDLSFITHLGNAGPYPTPFVAVQLACDERGYHSDEIEMFFIMAKAADYDLPSCPGVQPFQRVGSILMDVEKTDMCHFDSLGTHPWMEGHAEGSKVEPEDILLI
ncbi:hypothetical protein G7046_g3595 [Stylonectria norvegica]|nr:hypothetical protein G7046_g3595 [Stylonectria norvegica]